MARSLVEAGAGETLARVASYYLVGQKLRLRTNNHSLVWPMSFKEPQGQVAFWLGCLQYDSEIQRLLGRLHNKQMPFVEGPDDNMGICHRVLQQDYPK